MIDSPRGTRAITTLANESTAKPTANAIIKIAMVIGPVIASSLAGDRIGSVVLEGHVTAAGRLGVVHDRAPNG